MNNAALTFLFMDVRVYLRYIARIGKPGSKGVYKFYLINTV